jgi:type II secretion system protein G
MSRRKGFTLIELLVVVVIIGLLASIAIPKFAATKDKAKMAAVKSDLRNIMTAEEAYLTDNSTYGTLGQLQAATNFGLSAGNTGAVTAGTSGYTAGVTNTTITTGFTQCTVTYGGGSTSGVDGIITCS